MKQDDKYQDVKYILDLHKRGLDLLLDGRWSKDEFWELLSTTISAKIELIDLLEAKISIYEDTIKNIKEVVHG